MLLMQWEYCLNLMEELSMITGIHISSMTVTILSVTLII